MVTKYGSKNDLLIRFDVMDKYPSRKWGTRGQGKTGRQMSVKQLVSKDKGKRIIIVIIVRL